MNDIPAAYAFAFNAHRKQNRKPCLRTGVVRPYITHPMQVSIILYEFGITEKDLHCAGLLHDVMEDCDISWDYIHWDFNKRIADIVQEVTDPPGKGNEARRQKIEKTKTLSKDASIILAADMIANIRDIIAFPPWDHNTIKAYMKSNLKLEAAINDYDYEPLKQMKNTILVEVNNYLDTK